MLLGESMIRSSIKRLISNPFNLSDYIRIFDGDYVGFINRSKLLVNNDERILKDIEWAFAKTDNEYIDLEFYSIIWNIDTGMEMV